VNVLTAHARAAAIGHELTHGLIRWPPTGLRTAAYERITFTMKSCSIWVQADAPVRDHLQQDAARNVGAVLLVDDDEIDSLTTDAVHPPAFI